MAPGLVRTKVPGIYKRGKSYVVKQRDASGKIRTVSVATMAEAQDVKATIRAEKARGDLRPATKVRFDEYAPEWIRTYSGRTASGLKESTRDDYRRALERHAIPFFNRRALTEIEPRDIKLFAAHIAESGVAQHTVRLALAPVKALLATAFEDGLIRSNPSSNVRITIPNRRDTREEQAKALSEAQLNAVLDAATDRWRPLLELLANTGMRIGEGCALE